MHFYSELTATQGGRYKVKMTDLRLVRVCCGLSWFWYIRDFLKLRGTFLGPYFGKLSYVQRRVTEWNTKSHVECLSSDLSMPGEILVRVILHHLVGF